jgi:hypothetical protein
VKRPMVLLAALACAACPAPRPTGEAVPGPGPAGPLAPGRYTYTGRYLAPGEARPHEFRGVLAVTESTPERIGGNWFVPGFQTRLQLGAWVGGAYDADADVDHEGLRGTFKHRIVPGADGGVSCSAVFIARTAASGVSNPGTCTLVREGG